MAFLAQLQSADAIVQTNQRLSYVFLIFSLFDIVLCVKIGFSRKKIVPPCLGYQIFWSWLPLDFQSILPRIPEIFHFSHWTPWKSANSNFFWSNPLEFSIDILNRGGVTIPFRKSLIKWHLYHSWIDLMD